jgi:hypothetical protein
MFPFSGQGRETPILLGPLERANFNHWTVFTSYLEFRQKPSYSECYTSEPFTLYMDDSGSQHPRVI